MGSLFHLSIWTHLDLAKRCSQLWLFAHHPSPKNESSLCQVYALNFHGYSDAAYADHPSKNTSDYLFKFAYGLISKISHKHNCLVNEEAVWLYRLLTKLRYDSSDIHTVVIYRNNKPALSFNA
uniref:Uncharacterized protein n=1 Tax=Physcomitrium patens TaxID=3218 RepID=A0A2K1KQI3_PHYPA|nr:hypothetical protein PHYPA_006913 [Physcomitrium patens]